MRAAFRNARAWFQQAESDVRTAQAVLHCPEPMEPNDVGAHVAALCAQALEKSLKGYLFLNGMTPAMNHRPDKYLPLLLSRSGVRFESHIRHLAALFDTSTKGAVRELFDLTPGGLGNGKDTPNTEYPWLAQGEWRHTPYAHPAFAVRQTLDSWLKVTARVSSQLHRLGIAAEREV
jgi:hypothetical protein